MRLVGRVVVIGLPVVFHAGSLLAGRRSVLTRFFPFLQAALRERCSPDVVTRTTATRTGLRWMLLLALAGAVVLVWGTATGFGLTRSTAPSTQAPKTGVVRVNVLFASGAGGAGTGIVLTSSGEVLTNNHVIRGARTIRVTVPSTGRTYPATVEGYSIARDVALLDLQGAQGLTTATFGDSDDVQTGDSIVTVGNAGGTGLKVKNGRVVRLNRTITVRGEDGTPARLPGLIETNAPLRPGDSGGPLLLDGEVVGMDAAASMTLSSSTTGGEGYAIPIDTVLRIAEQIEAGHRSATVHVGPTAFLGVSLASATGFEGDDSGAVVEGVSAGSPAAKAGLGSGDVITAVAGRRVRTGSALRALMVRLTPGQVVRVTWVDPFSGRTTARVRLASGPPQ
jgi:S1-C subfamily serine protease